MTGLLAGAYDIHVHAGPDVRPRYGDGVRVAEEYQRRGFAGIVLKDHYFETVDRAYLISRLWDGFRAYGTLVLNQSVGGINPHAVRLAVRRGVAIVFMPTLDADILCPAFDRGREDRADPASSAWTLLGEVLVEVANGDVVFATGHAPPPLALELIREARRRGVRRLLVTHASMPFIRMPLEMQLQAADLGAFVEHSYVATRQREAVAFDDILQQVRAVGVDRCIVSTDFGQVENGSPAAGFAQMIDRALDAGFSETEVAQLARGNPRRLLPEPRW